MMAGGGGDFAAAGGPARHIPVLAARIVEYLAPVEGGVYIDATFGAGGYSRAILAAANARVLGIDRDRSAVARGMALVQAQGGRLTLAEGRFSELEHLAGDLGFAHADGVVFDLGVSSMQIDEAERGFSFRHDGPLDMRMGADGPSAADVVAAADARELAAIFSVLGEERRAGAVARAIIRARAQAPIRTTRALADIVASVVRSKPGEIHPATRVFQALRIFVNEELDELAAALAASERLLKPGGRLVVVSFHSLEDRIVKTFFAERGRAPAVSRHRPDVAHDEPTLRILTRKPVTPDADEIAANPRARSAKLRAAQRTGAPVPARPVATFTDRLPALDRAVKPR